MPFTNALDESTIAREQRTSSRVGNAAVFERTVLCRESRSTPGRVVQASSLSVINPKGRARQPLDARNSRYS